MQQIERTEPRPPAEAVAAAGVRTAPPVEIVLVNDRSGDDTAAIAAGVARQTERENWSNAAAAGFHALSSAGGRRCRWPRGPK